MSIRSKVKIAIIGAGVTVSATCHAQSGQQFDAEKVMKQMTSAERTSYLAGVVEGLAVARYMRDGNQSKGMNCIYDWFYDDKQTLASIHQAFDRFPTYPPGSIIHAMVKRKCGE